MSLPGHPRPARRPRGPPTARPGAQRGNPGSPGRHGGRLPVARETQVSPQPRPSPAGGSPAHSATATAIATAPAAAARPRGRRRCWGRGREAGCEGSAGVAVLAAPGAGAGVWKFNKQLFLREGGRGVPSVGRVQVSPRFGDSKPLSFTKLGALSTRALVIWVATCGRRCGGSRERDCCTWASPCGTRQSRWGKITSRFYLDKWTTRPCLLWGFSFFGSKGFQSAQSSRQSLY